MYFDHWFSKSIIFNCCSLFTRFQVFVTDVNDNKAVFSAPNYHFSILENVAKGAEVAQITASDLDYGVNGACSY